MRKNFKFCPFCGGNLKENQEYYECLSCKEILYKNFAYIGVGMVFVKDGKVLLSKRAIEPFKGGYDIIGGFLEKDEMPDKGILREVKEETGVRVKIVKTLGIYRDTYGKNNEPTVNIIYIGKIISGKMKPQDDISELKWFPIEKTSKLKTFKNVKEALKDLRNIYKKEEKSFE